ncbi:MAG TPA: GNAT family N-acetyltransferase, partial [Coriobacteriia bacterium]|nr:GNAT family N-acetyltransferase [Coriobacteriia bacterium]
PTGALIACLHLTPHARGRGLGTVLLRAALRDLAQRGVRSVQAFADATGRSVDTSPMMSVEFLLRQGFTVERAHPQVPLLKLDLRTLVSLNENLEAVLESLRIRIAVPRHAPATLSTPNRPR